MARINPKTGLKYVTRVKFSEQDKWKVTFKEACDLIRRDPDLTAALKQKAIIRLGELLDVNTRAEGMKLLNEIYKKAHGVTANHATPLSELTKKIIARRGQF